LGDLRVTYALHLQLVGKRVVIFLFAILELFSLALTVGTLSSSYHHHLYFMIGYQRVTDGGQTDGIAVASTALCIASNAAAL